ncbi:tetracycline repressor protein class H [Streptomyces sp. NRRL B-1568]|nr:tetracycline repressor protein class H [Streptomyces sp. NRRL B-1568]
MTRKRTRGERAGLSRAQILDTALLMADRDGAASLSMRRLGAELGVEAMTLYHYLPNKDALLDGLVERVLAGATPFAESTGWQPALRGYAQSLRAALLRHPGTLPLVAARPAATAETLRTVERGLGVMRAAGFPLGRALDAINSLTLFVVAHAASEVDTAPLNEAAAPGSTTFLAGLDPEEFPLLSEAARTGAGTDDDERFTATLDALITGFAGWLTAGHG